MTVRVFTGPTLRSDEVQAELAGAEVSGPAAFGDVYHAAKTRPRAILIIDGYFEHVPAVWHKEILWAMSEGIHVFGASSMGALRAAELADFGMHGVGAVYEAFRSGELEDDDEVTVVHGPGEEGFAPLSDAMVNIRATFQAARDAGVIGERACAALVRASKERFYAERCYAAALGEAEALGVDRAEARALRDWLPSGRVDLKRSDARLLLGHVRDWLAGDPKPMRLPHPMERTDAWLEAVRVADTFDEEADGCAASEDILVEDLKLAGAYRDAHALATARAAAISAARQAGFHPDAAAIRHAADELRRELGLLERKDLEAWRVEQRLDESEFMRFVADHARLLWGRRRIDPEARAQLADGLRVSGAYGRFAERVESKKRQLGTLGPRTPSLMDLGIEEGALWEWYFQGQPPADLDRFARKAGFSDKEDMRCAVIRHLHCERAREPRAS